MSNALLHQCVAFASRVEQAVLDLGAVDGPLASLPIRCAAFRRACGSLATNRGLSRVTVAFIGPRNAGKTTLAGLLVRDPHTRDALPRGCHPIGSTRRVLWVGPERPSDLDETVETWIACPPDALEDAVVPIQLADVPGFNDRDAAVRKAAERALEAALVKVLVVDERDLEAAELSVHLREADGAVLLPVVNRAGEVDPSDLAAFVRELRQAMPHGEVLEPLVIPDFKRRDQDEARVLDDARAAVGSILRGVLQKNPAAEGFAAPQLRRRLERFQADVIETAKSALPATAEAARILDESEQRLPREVLADVLGPDRALRALLRQRFRSIWVDNTPAVFFPWRLVLAISNLVWGALDRLPLLLMGSVPSLVSTAWVAVKNARSAAAFRDATTRGLRRHVSERATERLAPLIRSLQESLAVDLGRRLAGANDLVHEANVDGIGILQERSTMIVHAAVEQHAVGRAGALISALVGFVLFWVVAGWPLYALYLDYFQAATGAWAQTREALARFPSPTFAQLLTSILLGILPLAVWLLIVASWVTRPRRVSRCVRDLQLAHEKLIRELLDSGLLRVRLHQPELTAVRLLLGGGGAETTDARLAGSSARK